MKPIRLIILAALAALLPSCADVAFQTGGSAANGSPAYANSVRVRGLGVDLDQMATRLPDGSEFAVAGLNTSRGLGILGNTLTTLGMQKLVLGPAVKGWLGNKGAEIKEAGATSRAKIDADKAVELERLKPAEVPTAATPAP